MRDKIVDIIREEIGCDYDHNLTNEADAAAQILKYQCEEIEKVKNPHPDGEVYTYHVGFEDCREAILSLLDSTTQPRSDYLHTDVLEDVP